DGRPDVSSDDRRSRRRHPQAPLTPSLGVAKTTHPDRCTDAAFVRNTGQKWLAALRFISCPVIANYGVIAGIMYGHVSPNALGVRTPRPGRCIREIKRSAASHSRMHVPAVAVSMPRRTV
ncbi:MAG: hypothetical protein QNJ14_02900, partial [Woeseiaceae bacterium]|nr:hypothetical protein [Woeseiaceae bacterium]